MKLFSKPLSRVIIVVLLLGVYALTSLYSITKLSKTTDEGIHIISGYTYWLFNDYRLQPENGNLPQRIAAIPLFLQDVNPPQLDDPAMQLGHAWMAEVNFLYDSHNEALWIIFLCRSGVILVSVVIGLLVFFMARQYTNYWGGVMALVLYVAYPDVIAHGHLTTSDLMSAGFFLSSLWALQCVLDEISLGRILCLGLSVGALAITKFSVLFFAPVALICAVVHAFAHREIHGKLFRRIIHQRGFTPVLLIHFGSLLAAAAIAYAVIWTAYGYRFSPFAEGSKNPQMMRSWDSLLPEAGLSREILQSAYDNHLLPEAYLHGLANVMKDSKFRHSFLLGEYYTDGRWYFFPAVFLMKSPLGLIALMALLFVLGALWLNRRRTGGGKVYGESMDRALPLGVFIVVYMGFAMSSAMNIGSRHMLPVYLAGCILLVMITMTLIRQWPRLQYAVSILLGMMALETFASYPHFLSFFNQAVGGPSNGYLLMADSSVDWGQDLYLLDEWLREHNSGPDQQTVTLAYFGYASPKYLGIESRYLTSWGAHSSEAANISHLEPGLYAISATMLHGLFSRINRPWADADESKYQQTLDAMHELANQIDSPSAFYERVKQDPYHYRKLFIDFETLRKERLYAFLLQREPDARVGQSILIYSVTPEQLAEYVIDPSVGLPDDFPWREFNQALSGLIFQSLAQP